MSWVFACSFYLIIKPSVEGLEKEEEEINQLTSISQIVHVVSIEQAPIIFGSTSFQSKLVTGAQYSIIIHHQLMLQLKADRHGSELTGMLIIIE
jgi:hypothetical protein